MSEEEGGRARCGMSWVGDLIKYIEKLTPEEYEKWLRAMKEYTEALKKDGEKG